ncbi:MAG: DUF4382 domain-containing protein [Acidobacteria bacterium]|nr:MAG: DUF4382 domain-containing protein [Acidobacteriota bacterium]
MKFYRSYACTFTAFVFSFVLSLAVFAMISCGGSTTPTTATTGTVNLSMTDPATCTFAFSHVYVTVTKVTANIDPNADPNGSGWQTLIDLTNSPMQIDLLSLASPTTVCLLKSLGASGPLPPGKYQQIRLYLLDNSTSSSGSNLCQNNTGWNCVVSGTSQNPVYSELQLSSEVQTGIKIPSTNITSGGLTVTAGQSVDLNIDFQSCASIVHEGNGMYRLKPVLFAGEVSKNMNSISGQVVDKSNSNPVPNATVLFEQPSGGSEMIIDSTVTDSNGNFFVCPLPGSSYDIVVAAQVSGGSGTKTYNPTIAFSVPLGTNLGQIPLVPETLSTAVTGGAGTLKGQVDTSSHSEAVSLIPTMSATPTGGSATDVIIPVFTVNGTALLATGQPPTVVTVSPATPACTVAGANCYNYALTVSASNPSIGTFSSGSVTFGAPAAGNVIYKLTATSAGCTTTGTDSQTTPSPGVTADGTVTLPDLKLTGCN